MRAIWKGAVTFGLVNVPVKVYSATQDHDVPLHQVHDADGGRIRYQRRCEVCGKVVDYAHIDKAFDDGDRTVVITEEDLSALPEEKSREIDVVEFVPSDQVDPVMLDRSYFLEPDSSSPKSYALLRRTLQETDRTAIVHVTLRQRTRLAALRVRGDVLMLQTLLWDDEVREADFPSLDAAPKVSPRELKMSAQLVEGFAEDFDPSKFSDEYQEQLKTLIDAKLAQGDSLDTDATFGEGDADDDEGAGGEVLDLMDALKRSIERSRGGGSAAKKAAARKKAPAGKTAATGKTKASGGSADQAAEKSVPEKKSAKKPAAKKPAAKKPAAAKKSEPKGSAAERKSA
ncbi:non-homologous end joining protein Ku [Clavibacter michiganensis]|uniref:Non-homologous end joining protein Ku n=1 Tax=Clavibacter michiganensis subsp. insidiosus TaxID=33014 RepID=A0A0D5CJB5_9MICO|nr:Ku protein [Clavibacter michiganensis]AJW79347.1 DNA repair protein [Clavibacter michiganensis subsp. insidiosus]AWF97916.1 Ku protein [Clavibacter michiganensis subsp. insidiosus]